MMIFLLLEQMSDGLLRNERSEISRLVHLSLRTGSMLSHILCDSLLNLLHNLIDIHCSVCFSMLRVFALQGSRVDVQAFL